MFDYNKLFDRFSSFIIGSMQNGTVRVAKMLATIKNRLYLCSAFGKQVRELEY